MGLKGNWGSIYREGKREGSGVDGGGGGESERVREQECRKEGRERRWKKGGDDKIFQKLGIDDTCIAHYWTPTFTQHTL